jgi:hydrogenase expression/formation protein HypC
MCIGIPMRAVEFKDGQAWCEGRGGRLPVDTRLVDVASPGTWLLVFHNVAREVPDETLAGDVSAALDALEAALCGDTDLDRHFADCVNREPRLPEHLRRGPDRD